MAAYFRNDPADEVVVVYQRFAHATGIGLPEAGAALDIREDKRDYAAGKAHAKNDTGRAPGRTDHLLTSDESLIAQKRRAAHLERFRTVGSPGAVGRSTTRRL